jgi:protein phosphatase
VVAFIVVLVLLLAAAGGAVAYFARSAYYVGTRQQEVVIFQGRPGGLLWFKPTLQERTGHTVSDVPASQIADLHAGHEESTLADARRYARNLFAQAATERAPAADPTGSPTTTTASTVPTP